MHPAKFPANLELHPAHETLRTVVEQLGKKGASPLTLGVALIRGLRITRVADGPTCIAYELRNASVAAQLQANFDRHSRMRGDAP